MFEGSKRSQALRAGLGARFGAEPETVNAALVALIDAMRARLPFAVQVALGSWIPDVWRLVADSPAPALAARGAAEFHRRVVAAGIPESSAGAFIGAAIRDLGDRCGKPLAVALLRRIPELQDDYDRGAMPADESLATGAVD